MKEEELEKILEIHAGNEWRSLVSLIGCLQISQLDKDELLESISCVLDAQRAEIELTHHQ